MSTRSAVIGKLDNVNFFAAFAASVTEHHGVNVTLTPGTSEIQIHHVRGIFNATIRDAQAFLEGWNAREAAGKKPL